MLSFLHHDESGVRRDARNPPTLRVGASVDLLEIHRHVDGFGVGDIASYTEGIGTSLGQIPDPIGEDRPIR